jgi:hypothetical protein
MNENKGLLDGLLPSNIKVDVNVTIDNESLIKLCIGLVLVFIISLLVFGIIKKSI